MAPGLLTNGLMDWAHVAGMYNLGSSDVFWQRVSDTVFDADRSLLVCGLACLVLSVQVEFPRCGASLPNKACLAVLPSHPES